MKITDRKVSFEKDGGFYECISSPEEMLLFDIETTGLKKENSRLYLIGCGYVDCDGWHIRQWLSESPSDEERVLKSFDAFAEGFKILVSYNGEGFDIPFIAYKNRYYGADFDIYEMESLDLYKKLRPIKKLLGLKSLRQKAVEGFLCADREDKMDGGALIPYYYEYEITGSPENERLLLLHNFEDVLGMGKIFPALTYLEIPEGDFEYLGYAFEEERLRLEFILKKELPAEFDNGKISGKDSCLMVDLEIKDGKVLIPVKNPQDYYYLPYEDRIIHKDLAAFVDKKYKRKATRENCFLKVEKEKIPLMGPEDLKSCAMGAISCC